MNKISGEHPEVVFVFPPGGVIAGDRFFYSIGSAYIISYLRARGFNAYQFVCHELISLDKCVREILKKQPGIIGFTVYNTNFLTSVLVAEHIRKVSPGIIITFGGPAATNYSEFILSRYPFIDACFRNEGEETFLDFLVSLSESKFIFKNTDLSKVKGITYRSEDSIIVNADSHVLSENSILPDYLDKYPSPFLTGIIPGNDAFSTGLLTARGCNQHCIYCNCAVLSKRRITTHSVDRVLTELDFLSRYSDKNQVLNLFDDAFSLIPHRAKKICRAIIDNKIKISLSCMTRCDCADEELLDLMKEAGFDTIGFSLESAIPEKLRIIGKVHKPEDNPSDTLKREYLFIDRFLKMSAYAKKIGIRSVFSSIMTGLPWETLEEADKTIEVIDRCPDIDFYTHNLFTIYQGTPLSATYSKYGYNVELIDNNPVFSRTLYPDDIVYKVKVSPKSQFHEMQKSLQNITLRILSLTHEKDSIKAWFNNIILFSAEITGEFIDWLKMILALNGTIIHIYPDEAAFSENFDKNHETFIKYCSPSLNIRDYYAESSGSLVRVCNRSPLVRSENEKIVAKISDFNYFKSNLTDPETGFLNVICKESDLNDSIRAYSYFNEIKTEKNLFNYLINNKPFPYFTNLCRWTKDLSNCNEKKTLFVNDNREVRLCWYGPVIGKVGQTYDNIINNFEFRQEAVRIQRKCNTCCARDHCIKCISPLPFSEEDYCNRQIESDISKVAEMLISVDALKHFMN